MRRLFNRKPKDESYVLQGLRYDVLSDWVRSDGRDYAEAVDPFGNQVVLVRYKGTVRLYAGAYITKDGMNMIRKFHPAVAESLDTDRSSPVVLGGQEVIENRGFMEVPAYVKLESWRVLPDGRYELVRTRAWTDNAFMIDDRLRLARAAEGPDFKLEILGDRRFRTYRKVKDGFQVEEFAVNVDADKFFATTIGPHPEVFS